MFGSNTACVRKLSFSMSDNDIDFNLLHSKSKLNYENHLKKIGHELKCDECDFVGNTDLSIKKHVNTKHSIQNIEEQENNSSKTDCTIDGIEGIEDMFQLEILDGEQVYACNVCDQGFDIEDEIKKHIVDNHKEIMIEISKYMDNKVES